MNFFHDNAYWLAALPLSTKKIRNGLNFFTNLKNLFHASELALKEAEFNQHDITIIKNVSFNKIEKDLNWCEQNNCRIIHFQHHDYPLLLKEISNPPLVLFVQGDAALLKDPQLAIVGSRNPTPYGKAAAESFSYYLAKCGLVITSGLAAGIDTASHQGALKAHAKTVAVMGTGLAQIYPRNNKLLADEILKNGALVSEFPPDIQPIAQNFPRRNRIISGLSLGVLVVEAALKSGSLITARLANEQGREVFALPGSIHNPLARGCHQLIRQGAKLVETGQDILEELGALYEFIKQDRENFTTMSKYAPIDNKQQELLSFIGDEVTALDTLVQSSGLTIGQVSSMLLALELQGYTKKVPGGYIRKWSIT